MPFRSFAVALFLVTACAHTAPPATVVADNRGALEKDGEGRDIPDEFLDDSTITLNAEPDRAFLEQSLALALNPWNPTRLAADLRTFVQKASHKNRLFVRDPVTGQVRRLSLEKVHAEHVTPFNDGTAAVCTEFKDDSGDRIDLDFFVIRSDEGSFARITGQDIHRVNGKARFSYLEKDGGWVRSALNQTPPEQ